MKQYLEVLKDIRDNGMVTMDRTGVGTKSLWQKQMRFDLTQGFPLLTTKKCHWKSIVHELLWFIKGDTNIKYLTDNGVRIWNEWADENGDLGPVYGKQWRRATGVNGKEIDQLGNVIDDIKGNPFSRRLIVDTWNPIDIEDMALPPCHCLFQFKVFPDNNGKPKHLSSFLYQRSADIFLGVPFNIASYALLTMMIAQVTGLEAKEFVHELGDAHLYLNHMKQADEQLSRVPRALPKVTLNKNISNIDDFKFEDIVLDEYNPCPVIKAQVAV